MKLLIPFNYENPELSKTHETSQNELEPAERTQNQPKRPPKQIVKRSETTQNLKIGEIWHFLLAFVFQILSPNVQILTF